MRIKVQVNNLSNTPLHLCELYLTSNIPVSQFVKSTSKILLDNILFIEYTDKSSVETNVWEFQNRRREQKRLK